VLLCLPLLTQGLVMPWKAQNKADIAQIKDDSPTFRTLDEWSDSYIDQVIENHDTIGLQNFAQWIILKKFLCFMSK